MNSNMPSEIKQIFMYARQVSYEDGDLTPHINSLFENYCPSTALAAMSLRKDRYREVSENESDSNKAATISSMADSIDEAINTLVDWANN